MKPSPSILITLLLLLSTISSAGDFRRLTDRVSLSYLTTHVRMLERAGGHFSRVALTAGLDSGIAYVKHAFEALPHLSSLRCDTFYLPSAPAPYNTKPMVNVEATILGRTHPDQVYVIGAHLDCSASHMGTWTQQWSTITAPGADDNATGVASLLEMARILSDSSFGFISDATLKFVTFGVEEGGPVYTETHAGSTHYAAMAKARGEQILAMISVDMIGYNPLYYTLAVGSNSASEWLGRKVIEANDSTAQGLIMNAPPFPTGSYSDHVSFWGQGYPAICLIEWTWPWNSTSYYAANPYYHSSNDSASTVNMELVRRVTKVTLATVAGLSGTLTGVEEPAELPGGFALEQNYPNPFNPATMIDYTVGEGVSGRGGEGGRSVSVQLIVYDILGREVKTLVNEPQRPGHCQVQFNGAGLSSGVYFYRLVAGSFVQVKRMVLMK